MMPLLRKLPDLCFGGSRLMSLWREIMSFAVVFATGDEVRLLICRQGWRRSVCECKLMVAA